MTIKPFINTSKKIQGNKYRIYIYLYHNRRKKEEGTEYVIEEQFWDKEAGQVLKTYQGHAKINNGLKTLCLEIENRWLNNPTGSLEDFLRDKTPEVAAEPARPGRASLIQYFELYIDKRNIKETTARKIRVVKHLLEKFDREETLMVKSVNIDFQTQFEKFCRSKGYSHNTISKAVVVIKSVCSFARLLGEEVSAQLEAINVKYVKSDKIFLPPDELTKIEKTELQADYLDNARDWLLISCETGQRVSDFLKFKKTMIRMEAGKSLIEFTQQKTGKIMTVPLSKKVLSILKKRKGEFPREISDQKYNDYIKEVCKLAGLTQKIKGSRINKETNRKETGVFPKWQLISSHVGRRSFATNYYGIIPTSLLISATGHATERQFLEYIGKTDTQKAMQLAEYF